MAKLISIAVQTREPLSPCYLAINTDGHVWRGEGGQTPGSPMIIGWERVTCEFPGSSESKSPRVTFKMTRGPQKKGRLPKGTFTLQPPKKGRREED
jgi:hypothetical protein